MGAPDGHIIEAADIYRIYFHGPAYQVVERAWWDGDRMVGLMAKGLPGNHHPSELPTLMAPRLIELCFQTAGLWEMGAQGRMGLPLHVHQVSLSTARRMPAEGSLLCRGHSRSGSGEAFDAEVVDAKGKPLLALERLPHGSGSQTRWMPSG